MRYLGIDYGTKRIGLALSDEAGTMGFPHAIVPAGKELLDHVLNLISERDVGAVVIGESLNFSGEENPLAHDIHAFSAQIEKSISIPIFFESEMFTTQEARRIPTGERTITNKHVDDSAAALILTSFLSHHDNTR